MIYPLEILQVVIRKLQRRTYMANGQAILKTANGNGSRVSLPTSLSGWIQLILLMSALIGGIALLLSSRDTTEYRLSCLEKRMETVEMSMEKIKTDTTWIRFQMEKDK